MTEELFDEPLYLKRSMSRQRELIAEACRGIDKRITSASTAAEAQRIVEEVCSAFERECPSEIVRTRLVNHIRSLSEHHWGSHK